MFEIKGKVAMVTGALGGIGRCYVKALLNHNIKGVALVDINIVDAENFQTALEDEFGQDKFMFIKADVADTQQLKDAYNQTIKRFQQLDIVINNVVYFDEVNIERNITVNLISTAASTDYAIKHLNRHKTGEEAIVINTASIAGLNLYPGFPMYCLAKHAMVTLGRCLGTPQHFALSKVKVITICPGMTDTDLIGQLENLPDYLQKISQANIEEDRKMCQRPESVGDGLIKVLNEGNNGSVWLVQNNEPAKQIDFAEMDQLMKKQLQ